MGVPVPVGIDELEGPVRAEPPDGDPARHRLQLRDRCPEQRRQRQLRPFGRDADVIELGGAEQGVAHVTVEGRW